MEANKHFLVQAYLISPGKTIRCILVQGDLKVAA
jgi:glutathione synthase/RimK-type ligase-like ATP-grasp enzyme